MPGSVFDFPGNFFRIGFSRQNMPEVLKRFEQYLKAMQIYTKKQIEKAIDIPYLTASITPHATRAPEFPTGCETKSSGSAWRMTDLPMIECSPPKFNIVEVHS